MEGVAGYAPLTRPMGDGEALIMRGRPVHGGGLAGGLFGVGHALGEARHLALQPLDQLPLRRDGRVQILNRLVLMDHTHFKLVEAGCVCHVGGVAPAVRGGNGES